MSLIIRSPNCICSPLRLDYGRSPHAYVNQRLQIQLGLLMMSDIPLETCSAFNELWNNKFRYQVASCWLLLLKYLCHCFLSNAFCFIGLCVVILGTVLCGTAHRSGKLDAVGDVLCPLEPPACALPSPQVAPASPQFYYRLLPNYSSILFGSGGK